MILTGIWPLISGEGSGISRFVSAIYQGHLSLLLTALSVSGPSQETYGSLWPVGGHRRGLQAHWKVSVRPRLFQLPVDLQIEATLAGPLTCKLQYHVAQSKQVWLQILYGARDPVSCRKRCWRPWLSSGHTDALRAEAQGSQQWHPGNSRVASWRHTADVCPASSSCSRVLEGTAITPTVDVDGAGWEAWQ